jgi:hypothetical protein
MSPSTEGKQPNEWWRRLRWLLLLPAILLAVLIGIFVLYISTALLQPFYFGFLDTTGRSASRHVASLSTTSFSVIFALLVAGSILWIVLALISPGFRRRIGLIVTVSFGVFLAANLGLVIGVLTGSHPERMVPKLSAVWRTDQLKVPSDVNTFAATRVMVFPDDSHVVLESDGKLNALDAQTGQLVAKAGSEGFQPYIFASSNGNVVVSAGGRLQLFSSQLKPLNISFDLTGGEANRASPSGARIGWQRFSKDAPKTVFLDTESLKPKETFASCNIEAMSDQAVADSVVLVNENSTPAINVCEPGNSTYVFYRGPFQPFFYFYLKNEVMLILSGSHLKVINQQGTVLGEDDWPGEDVNFAGVSRDGSRFAIATERWGFGDPPFINKEAFVVYETSSVRPIGKIQSPYPPSLQSPSALSPDGKAFAIWNGSEVSYFRLP